MKLIHGLRCVLFSLELLRPLKLTSLLFELGFSSSIVFYRMIWISFFQLNLTLFRYHCLNAMKSKTIAFNQPSIAYYLLRLNSIVPSSLMVFNNFKPVLQFAAFVFRYFFVWKMRAWHNWIKKQRFVLNDLELKLQRYYKSDLKANKQFIIHRRQLMFTVADVITNVKFDWWAKIGPKFSIRRKKSDFKKWPLFYSNSKKIAKKRHFRWLVGPLTVSSYLLPPILCLIVRFCDIMQINIIQQHEICKIQMQFDAYLLLLLWFTEHDVVYWSNTQITISTVFTANLLNWIQYGVVDWHLWILCTIHSSVVNDRKNWHHVMDEFSSHFDADGNSNGNLHKFVLFYGARSELSEFNRMTMNILMHSCDSLRSITLHRSFANKRQEYF